MPSVEDRLTRRWACVLSLDVVGFSRLMAQDDMAAVRALRECREIVERHVSQSGGRIFGAAGDSFMIEFPAADAAVRCAIAIQKATLSRNEAVDRTSQMSLRAGIAAGTVVDDGGNLFGDTVNIAARLQEVCAVSGVLVSHAIETAVAGRLSFRAAGELSLKNIPAPVPIFEVMDGDVALRVSGADLAAMDLARAIPGFEGAPVLAVLPLANSTGLSDQEPACRGFSEDLINLLSRMRQFAVIDRNSTFAYTSYQSGADAFARRIGARYLVEGRLETIDGVPSMSVRMSDLETGRQTWSDTRALLADQIGPALEEAARAISATLDGRIAKAEGARFRARRESRVGVRGLVWRARWHLDQLTARDAEEALRLLREAESLEPDNAEVLIQLAHWHWVDAWSMRKSAAAVANVRGIALKARDADPQDGRGHLLVGVVDILQRNLDEAQDHLSQAVELNPCLAIGHAQLGSCHNLKGEYTQAIPQLERSLRLSPEDYYVFYVLGELAISYCMLGDYSRAIAYARKALALRPSYWNARMSEIAALVHLGDMESAALSFQTLMFRTPKFSPRYIDWLPYRECGVARFFADAIERAQKFSATLA